MDISRIRALRGPNLWSRHTSIEAVVTCTDDENAITDRPGFEPRLRKLFPAIGAMPVDPPVPMCWRPPCWPCRKKPAAR